MLNKSLNSSESGGERWCRGEYPPHPATPPIPICPIFLSVASSSVLLRQNPHNCAEWLNRVKLCGKDDVVQIIQTYSQAVTTIDPQKATGRWKIRNIYFLNFLNELTTSSNLCVRDSFFVVTNSLIFVSLSFFSLHFFCL